MIQFIILKEMREKFEQSNQYTFFVDGFPRNTDNLHQWKTLSVGKAEMVKVIYLDLPNEVCIERCLGRAKSSTEKREDDTLEIITNRVKKAWDFTGPVVAELEKENLVEKIDSNCPIEEMCARGLSTVSSILKSAN